MSVVDAISTCVKSPLDLSRPLEGKQDTAKIRLPPKVPLLYYALAVPLLTPGVLMVILNINSRKTVLFPIFDESHLSSGNK